MHDSFPSKNSSASARRILLGVIFSLLIFTFTVSPVTSYAAEDTWTKFLTSPADDYNPPGLDAAFDITQIDIAVSKDQPDLYQFFVNFVNPITEDQFKGKKFTSIMMDANNDGEIDFSIDTSNDTYVDHDTHAADLVDRRNGGNASSSLCVVDTWTDLQNDANWIGFSVPINCLPFSKTIGIQGYADSGATKGFDYAPSDMWQVDLSADSNQTVTTLGNSNSELPKENSGSAEVLNSPSSAPEDLAGLAAKLTKSVVTVFCADGLGSGWAANVNFPAGMRQEGYKTYIITNFHVIASCTNSPSIKIVLHDGSEIEGKVWAWDENQDVAGIVTTESLPTLSWRGKAPQQGWWVGVLGSPLGHPGVLTTGIVSSIGTEFSSLQGTTSAPINHGNSGGPVFDRSGRVLGLATAVYVDSQGFGIFNGTPMLCGPVLDCSSQEDVWVGAASNGSSSGRFPLVLILLVIGAIGVGILLIVRSSKNKNSRVNHGVTFTPPFQLTPPPIPPGMSQSFSNNSTPPTPPGSVPPPPGSIPPPPKF